MHTLTPPIQSSEPAYNTVATKILEYIRHNQLQPGDKLPTEQQMGKQMEVSRTVIREAVKVLTTVGVVRPKRGSGLYVTNEPRPFASTAIEFSVTNEPENVLHLFEFRTILEPVAAAQAAERISPRELRRLEGYVQAYRNAAQNADSVGCRDADLAFHMCIAQATRNPLIASSLSATQRLQNWAYDLEQGVKAIIPAELQPHLQLAVIEHQAIFEAISHGESMAADTAMRKHLASSQANYQLEVRRRMGT